MASDFSFLTCTRKRWLVRPYSPTRSSRLFPDAAFFLPASFGVRNILVRGRRPRIPTVRVMIPTGRNDKNERGAKPAPWSVSLTIRLGGVPIRVIIPPMLLANARGMRSLLGDVPADAAILTTIGIITATVPVLLTTDPIVPVTIMTRRKSLS